MKEFLRVAERTAAASAVLVHVCGNPACPNERQAGKLQCAQCGLRYCCRTCQSANFAEHRGRCQAEERTRCADLISTTAELPEKFEGMVRTIWYECRPLLELLY